MSKRSSKNKRRSKTLPALGFAGISFSMASGACASTNEASANTPAPSQSNELFLGEEELSDVSLATFYVFDKENAGAPPLAQQLRLAAGGGCGGGGGGGGGGCGGGGGGGGGGGCGGKGCGGGGGGGKGCGGGGCGGKGCGAGGCGGGCAHGGCRGCRCGVGGCGGCSCSGCTGPCWIWTPLGWVCT
jgi:hypothetical protein